MRRWIVLVLVVALVGVGTYAVVNYFQFVTGVSHIGALPSSSDLEGKPQNILLIGDDHRPAGATPQQLADMGTTQDGGGTNTDTMMVLHIPATGSNIRLISLPRDSWVAIPGYGMNKLNAAFALGSLNGKGDSGGAKLLINTVQNLTGLTINHFVRVSLLGFYTIAQALGPIQVCLNHAVKDPYSTIDLPAGVSTLNAQQALAFVRQRHGLPNGDLDREVRQQYFLSLEAHKIVSAGTLLNPVTLHNVLSAVSSSIQTDPGLDLISLAVRLQGVTSKSMSAATIPVSGTPTISTHGQSVSIVQVNLAAMPSFIASITGESAPKSALDKATAAAPSSVTTSVLNGRAVTGAAGRASATLHDAGFVLTGPGTTTSTTFTTVEYPAGMEAQAKALLAYVPGAQAKATQSVTQVTLVLGMDGLFPVAHPPVAASTSTPSSHSTTPSTESSPQPKSYSAATCVN